MARVVLAMSGGVDSSVAAHLLLEAGHQVVGVFMRHGEESTEVCQVSDAKESEAEPSRRGELAAGTEPTALAAGPEPIRRGELAAGGNRTVDPAEKFNSGDASSSKQRRKFNLPVTERAGHRQGCCTASDAADARRVAAKFNIPFYALDLQQDFRRIVDYFVDDYLNGRTPNPCVKCNHWIKFGRLFDYADGIDAQFVATGHYARMESNQELHRGRDSAKDQSYALFGIDPDRLSRMLLPVGCFTKPKIREIAESLNLGVAGKKDSQEICFVTQGHHSDFVRAREPKRSADTGGQIVTVDGTVVGQHDGYEAFTVGQRKGLGVAMGSPYFVVRIEPGSRLVVIGPKESLDRATLSANEANWFVEPADLPDRVSVQIRYNGQPMPARIAIDPNAPDQFDVAFDEPQFAVAPGQAAVVYDRTRVLGGGWIV